VYGVCGFIAEIKWECVLAARSVARDAIRQTVHTEADLAPAAHLLQVRDGCKFSTKSSILHGDQHR
jgi:hypothetical protein